jgi:hypothetical protein
MSEIAIHSSSRQPAVRSHAVDLMTFADEASQVRRIAQVLCQTDFVPEVYRNRPDEVTAVILFGRELNVGPMVSLQTINVIKGRPSLSANLMRAQAQKAGIVFEIVEQSDEKVVMRAQPLYQQNWTYSTWDLPRARKADLLRKEMWQKYPRSMMIARCTSELCRLVASDVIMGMAYSSEELTDMDSPDVAPVEEKPKKTVRRKATYEPPAEMDWPEPTPVPVLAVVPPAEEPQEVIQEQDAVEAYPDSYSPIDDEGRVGPEVREPKPDAVGPKTRAALMAGFNDKGIRDRSKRLEMVSKILGREVLSVNQLTETEGRKVVTALHEDGWPQTVEVPQ